MSNFFSVSNDFADMDIDLIHRFLTQSYWAKNIPKAIVAKAVKNSLSFAVLDHQQHQVGFARLVTDTATFAYLADVFILPQYRGQGLSKLLMQSIVVHPDLQGLRRIMLATNDAHGLYEKFGFEPLNDPALFMQKWNPEVYSG